MSIVAFHSPASALHNAPTFFRHGRLVPHPETSVRYTTLLEALSKNGIETRVAGDFGTGPVLDVHDPKYVEFLSTAWARRREANSDDGDLIATQFPRRGMEATPTGLQGLLGVHLCDTSTSIRHDTWPAVLGSAHGAVAATDFATTSGEVAYALCRPPGHHAYADYAGGFCYLNNSAIAAARARRALQKNVAVLDIDVHHGNGTQGIFYARNDVLTVSIHADPSDYFPHYSGYADEVGVDAGRGFNMNLPLAQGSVDAGWLATVRRGFDRVMEYRPAALVVALGLDASEDDPIGALKVTTEGFAAAGAMIGRFPGPVVLVQEGGYASPVLGANLVAVLKGVESARR